MRPRAPVLDQHRCRRTGSAALSRDTHARVVARPAHRGRCIHRRALIRQQLLPYRRGHPRTDRSAAPMSVQPRYLSITIVASLAGLLFGFDTAVISGVTQSLRDVFHLSSASLGTAVSSALWGTLCGALFMGKLGDRFGTRDMLKLVGLFYLVSAVGCSMAWNLPSFIVFRFIGGIGIGGSSVLAPVYISEIAPAQRRGALVGLFQFNIVLGILAAYLSNFALSALLPGADVWRWKLLSGAVPAAVFLSLLFVIPQSPRWLASARIPAQRHFERQCGAVLARVPAADSAGDQPGIVQPALRHQRHPLLPERYLPRRRLQLDDSRSAIGGRGSSEPAGHGRSAGGDRPARAQATAADRRRGHGAGIERREPDHGHR